jgi:hypothetical protein
MFARPRPAFGKGAGNGDFLASSLLRGVAAASSWGAVGAAVVRVAFDEALSGFAPLDGVMLFAAGGSVRLAGGCATFETAGGLRKKNKRANTMTRMPITIAAAGMALLHLRTDLTACIRAAAALNFWGTSEFPASAV